MAAQPIPVLIPRSRVSQITGMQRSALYEPIARGDFPKPVTIGSAAVRWIEAEVVAWCGNRSTRAVHSNRPRALAVNAPEVGGGGSSGDVKAIAPARVEFWMRWRGELPSYAASRRQDAIASLDAAVIRLDQLHALAGLLSLEEVAEEFAGLALPGRVSIFGLFEDGLGDVRAALTQGNTQPIT